MAVQKQLGQLNPGAANTSIYTPPADTEASGLILTVCETGGVARTFRVFQDHDGSTYGDAQALYYDYPIEANATLRFAIGPMNNTSGNIAVYGSTADVTFTLHGTERLIA